MQHRRRRARQRDQGRDRRPRRSRCTTSTASSSCTDDLCTHGPGSLSEGYIDGDVVECNFHNGQFNIKTGEVVSPPCMVPIKTYPATVEDGKVFIEV